MGNKLRDIFMPYLKWQDKSIIDENPCNTCPIHQEYMEKALYGSVAERNCAEPPDCCPCIKKLTWEGECLAKLEWYESQDRRLHPELLEKPKQAWISVEERLPETNGTYLIFTKIHFTPDHVDDIDYYYGTEISTYAKDFGFLSRNGHFAKAWMPLPEPPEENNHGQTDTPEM